jgi:NAD(P)-dependent dehydrogenase (short-subunit alcohol dehydrogenase family)
VKLPIDGNLKGRICLVTGASTGIGKEIARGLARLGGTVILAVRSAARGEAAQQEIIASTQNRDVHVMLVDLASQRSIREFAQEFDRRYQQLHVLVNNAGVWTTTKKLSPDGIEMMWATNVLGYHLLTRLLLPKLKQSTPARIVNVASSAAKGLELSDVQYEKRKYNDFTAYSQTKQANRMLSWALAEELQGSGVTVTAGNPGLIKSELSRETSGVFGAIFSLMQRIMARTPAEGADTFVWMAAAKELEGVSNKFFSDRKEVQCKFRDPAAIRQLVTLCDQQTAG